MKPNKKISRSNLFIAVCCMLAANIALAQGPPPDKDDIEARRVGFITQQLQLTTQEAQVFWPVYNRYHDELETLRKKKMSELLGAKMNFDNYTDEQVSKLIDEEMDSRQKELDLQRKYNVEFKKVLPVKKVALLYRAEQQFKVNLIRNMNNQGPGMKPGGQPGQPKNAPNH